MKMSANERENSAITRQERRQKKLRKKREQMKKHGKTLAQWYKEVILKRVRGGE